MCEFSHTNSKLVNLKYKDAIIGSRFFKFKDNRVLSLYLPFEFGTKKSSSVIPDLNGDLGFYSYNNNYYYKNNNYYYYYKNNNYYSYNYNNYKNNNNNYYKCYHLAAITKSYGKVIIHNLGQRSEKLEITAFLSLKDHDDKNFLSLFNDFVAQIAAKFKVKVVPFKYGENPIEEYNKLIGQ